MLPIPTKKTQQKKNGYTCTFKVLYHLTRIQNTELFMFWMVLTLHLNRLMLHVWLTNIASSTLYCAEEKISDTDGGVKESLNGVSTELIGGEREKREDQGIGRVRGDRYGKGRKNYQRHLTCSSSHYFPQFLSLENMQQHTKTATTCSLQAPCNNNLGQPSHSFPTEIKSNWATWPIARHLRFS